MLPYPEKPSPIVQVFFSVRPFWYKYVPEPSVFVYFTQFFGKGQGIGVRYSGQQFMFCRVYVFYVQQHQVGKAQEFFHICIHEIAVGVQSGVYSFFFEKTEQRYEFAGMYQRLSSGYGNSPLFPKYALEFIIRRAISSSSV